jgi:hypothetical protein
MPMASEDPAPPCAGEAACTADSDGEPVPDDEPSPLHTSDAALRTEGDAAPAPALDFGATELANTDRPPLRVTPAVAPRTRAENCDAGDREAAPEPPAWLRAVPLPLPLLAPLVRLLDRAAPDVVPDATELPADEPEADPEDPEEEEAALDAEELAGLAAAPAPPPDAAELPPPAGGDVVCGGGGAVPEAGIPVSGAVQAQARLTPTTAVASAASTANEKRRTRLSTRNRLIRSEPELIVEHT